MKLKPSYQFLYMPEDHGPTRVVRVPRWGILTGLGVAVFLAGLALLFVVGLWNGNGWLPGDSELELENVALTKRIVGLEFQVDGLRGELDRVQDVQQLVATAVNLTPLDRDVAEAGIGGRSPLNEAIPEVPGLDVQLDAGGDLGQELDRLVRQARIQRQGFQAILDTLDHRSVVRGQIPSIRPTDTGWLSSRFGFRKDPFTGKQAFHGGLDFSVPLGTEVRVTAAGRVVAVQKQRGLGKVVKVDHGNDVMTVYAHLDQFLVKKGEQVKRGQVIARSGNTGRSTGPHLHYEVRLSGRAVNPVPYILDSYADRH